MITVFAKFCDIANTCPNFTRLFSAGVWSVVYTNSRGNWEQQSCPYM